MSESHRHLAGVAALERFVRARVGERTDLVMYRDLPESDSQSKPPIVGGFRPDLFARTWKDGAIVIGEAKTTRDLESARSVAQIRAFVQAVRDSDKHVFVLSVPIGAAASGRALLSVLADGDSSLNARLLCISPGIEDIFKSEVF